ncbi:hypothetical protein SLA2020_439520 [Shorea laevis]
MKIDKEKCFDLDNRVAIYACVFRSLIDAFYALHINFQFRTGFIAPSSRVFGRAELNADPKVIAKRYLFSYFIIDILSILPLPQVLVFIVIPSLKTQVPSVMKEMLKAVVFSQYVPRLIRIYPLYIGVTRSSGVLEIVWFRAAYNLFLYMLASHVVGALWYLFAIQREGDCWQKMCKEQEDCRSKISTAEITTFLGEILYCFWWGLRNLSSLGQNLQTGTFVLEILFAVSISISGLVLFALLIGNFQVII